ncbi:IS1096 element passenger TnpR family protein [Trichococcus alkaliphilus]|uniref:IS1096 element passenger TnpR family protein n=1 Tax=Trichococcus alkaliphilus TaxID=2052943 RepID=UPI000D0BCE29|nr:hypothetical protein [Trichococcus alkaliphilus]
MIYEFRVAVRDIGVPIWRDIQVSSDETFYDFNSIIQAAFSWSGFFEHRFEITRSGGTDLLPIIIEETPLDTLEDYTDESDLREYSNEEREDVDEIEENDYDYHDENDNAENEDQTLQKFFTDIDDAATYIYFTDAVIEVDIQLTEMVAPQEGGRYPICVAAENASPDEMEDRSTILQNRNILKLTDTQDLIRLINFALSQLGDSDIFDAEYEDFGSEYAIDTSWDDFPSDDAEDSPPNY